MLSSGMMALELCRPFAAVYGFLVAASLHLYDVIVEQRRCQKIVSAFVAESSEVYSKHLVLSAAA